MADTATPTLPGPDSPPSTPDPAIEAGRFMAERLLELADDAERDAAALGALLQMLQAAEIGATIDARNLAALIEPWAEAVQTLANDLAAVVAIRAPASYGGSGG